MAFPTILVNSTGGSDTAASGAGPATALTGSAASTSGTGLVVTLDGSPDLTNVATDGSHAIFLNDSTAGKRNFGRITAKDNVAKTVTVDIAFALSASGLSWAIGGKRASIGATTSRKLFDNNTAQGDARGGWTIKMESAHAETLSSTLSLRSLVGNTTNGPIIICGDPAASLANRPTLTFSNNGNGIAYTGCNYIIFRYFQMKNTNATKTASVGILGVSSSGSSNIHIEKVKIADSTDKFWRGIYGDWSSGNDLWAILCEVGYCAAEGIYGNDSLSVDGCYVHDCTSHGVRFGQYHSGITGGSRYIKNSVIVNNGGRGIYCDYATPAYDSVYISNNTVAGNTSHNIEVVSKSIYYEITNNILSGSTGGYGFNPSTSGFENQQNALGSVFRNNNTYNNSSGAISGNTSTAQWLDDPQLNPQLDANFDVGNASLRDAGYRYPSLVGMVLSSYGEPGAVQHLTTGGGSVIVIEDD